MSSNDKLAKADTLRTLSLNDPSDIMGFSKTLRSYIEKNGLSVNIAGNQYAMVDGWKFAGANFGLTALPEEPQAVHESGQYITILYKMITVTPKGKPSFEKEIAFFAGFQNHKEVIEEIKKEHKVTKEIIRPYFAYRCNTNVIRLSDGFIVMKGSALCSNLEIKKSDFDDYSVQSMSQTRSIGKSYRNLIGYVMKAAGMETTPAEEMEPEMVDKKPKEEKPKVTDKIVLTPQQYINAKEAVRTGKKKLQNVLDNCNLSEVQINELTEVDFNRLDAKNQKK